MIMTGICRNIFVWACAFSAHTARADDALIIRGDQSASMLSDFPAAVSDSPDTFSVRPRMTKKDELVLLLGNADLFITPPAETHRSDASAQISRNPNSDKKSSIGVPP